MKDIIESRKNHSMYSTINSDLKYSEILAENANLGKNLTSDIYDIFILSNIINTQLNEILEYELRIASVPALVKQGDYDNILQSSLKYKDSKSIIIFWELSNLINGLQYKIQLFNDNQYNEIL